MSQKRAGRKPVYQNGVAVINVPLTLSSKEADVLRTTVAPTRSAAARTVVQRHVFAVDAAKGKADPGDDRAATLETLACIQRLLVTARAIQDDAEVARLTARSNELWARLAPVAGGLTVAE